MRENAKKSYFINNLVAKQGPLQKVAKKKEKRREAKGKESKVSLDPQQRDSPQNPWPP